MAIEIGEIEKSGVSAMAERTVKIKPFGARSAIDLAEIWQYRELIYFLAWRDVKVRYKQTALGIVWVLLQPILTTLIFSILFARVSIGQTETAAVSYPLFAFSGFVLWSFANNALAAASNSLVNHSNLITKVYFPRLVMPLAAVAAIVFDLLLNLAALLTARLFFGASAGAQILLAPFFVFLLVVFCFALGVLLAAINVRFRDVRFALPFALQILMFASPVFYSLDFLPERWRAVWKFNPLTGILDGFRAAVFNLDFDRSAILISITVTVLLLVFALLVFRRMEDDFADII